MTKNLEFRVEAADEDVHRHVAWNRSHGEISQGGQSDRTEAVS